MLVTSARGRLVPHTGTLVSERRVVIGIPNTGRLRDEVTSWIGARLGGFEWDRSLLYESESVVVACARSNDLPALLADGMVDLAITGRDYVHEAQVRAVELCDLGFQRGKICLLGRSEDKNWMTRRHVHVATQYPGITELFFAAAQRPEVVIHAVSGAAELFARTGAVDLIVDAYQTGETATSNGLTVLASILETSACLFARPGWTWETKDIASILSAVAIQ